MTSVARSNGRQPEAPEAIGRDPIDARQDFLVLAAKMLEQCRKDLDRPGHCATRQLAIAWVIGRHPCGCPYESIGPSFEDVCRVLFGDLQLVEIARDKLLAGVDRTAQRTCRKRDGADA